MGRLHSNHYLSWKHLIYLSLSEALMSFLLGVTLGRTSKPLLGISRLPWRLLALAWVTHSSWGNHDTIISLALLSLGMPMSTSPFRMSVDLGIGSPMSLFAPLSQTKTSLVVTMGSLVWSGSWGLSRIV